MDTAELLKRVRKIEIKPRGLSSHLPVRGYARGILSLLKGARYVPEAFDFDTPQERSQPSGSQAASPGLKIAPVPASTQVSISWPDLGAEALASLSITNAFGQPISSIDVPTGLTTHLLDVTVLPIGVYFIVVSDKGKPIYNAKFTVQR